MDEQEFWEWVDLTKQTTELWQDRIAKDPLHADVIFKVGRIYRRLQIIRQALLEIEAIRRN
jgi:hypothetical protein